MKHLPTFESFLNESLDENLNEAYVPSNVLDFAKRQGSFATSLVKKAATWAEKARQIVSTGGTAIGKNYSTIILDMKYQGSEIYINLDNETIKLYGEEVEDAKSFKKVLDENSVNESADESLTVIDYDEFVNPDKVKVTLSNKLKLEIEKKRVQGGAKTYQAILQSLDAYNDNPKAKEFIDNLVNGMVKQLRNNG
jgi:hypothetical protein